MLALVLLGAAGCGGFNVSPVTPASGPQSLLHQAPVAVVQVSLAQMAADKVRMLQRFNIPQLVQQRVSESFMQVGRFDPAAGLTVQVVFTGFRNPRYGPALMEAQVQVIDGSGQVLRAFQVGEVTNRVASRTSRLRVMTQSIVSQIANGV